MTIAKFTLTMAVVAAGLGAAGVAAATARPALDWDTPSPADSFGLRDIGPFGLGGYWGDTMRRPSGLWRPQGGVIGSGNPRSSLDWKVEHRTLRYAWWDEGDGCDASPYHPACD
jgi:hypothetical protein